METPRGIDAAKAIRNRFRRMASALAGCLALVAALTPGPGCAEVLVSNGFEACGDTWPLPDSAGGGTLNSSSGPDDFPADQRICGGDGSWLVGSGVSVLISSEIMLSGWRNASVGYRVSSTAAAGCAGNTPDDCVAAYVATTSYGNQSAPAFGLTADIALSGWGVGAVWGYDSGASPVVESAGANRVFHPDGGGLRGDDGYNDFSILIPDGKRSLALKLFIISSGQGKFWNIDDVTLQAAPTEGRDRWWDGDGVGTVGGGGGDWNNPARPNRWADRPAGQNYSAWDDANGDNAFFTQTGGAVKIAARTAAAVRSLTFAADGYSIAGEDSTARLVLTNGGSGGPGPNTIEVSDPAHTAAINLPIAGNPGVGLTKTGAGTLALGGANQYTGPTTIESGTVRVSAANRLGAVGAPVAFDGGTLQFAKAVDLKDYHPFTFLDGGGTVDTQSFTCTTATDGWSGAGALAKRGAGTLVLQGANDAFAGPIFVQEGILRVQNNGALDGCPTIDLAEGAVLDAAAIDGGYRLGFARRQTLQGLGAVRGGLVVGPLGVHELGHSPGVQFIDGDYSMRGELQVEIAGPGPGGAEAGYDQVRLDGGAHDVFLAGALSLAWSGAGWASPGDMLWIIRNDTAGTLAGEFAGLADGDPVGAYDGLYWRIYYGADAESGLTRGGNDVLLMSVAVPEPAALPLLLLAGATFAAGIVLRSFCCGKHS